jgi:hypothetical protein
MLPSSVYIDGHQSESCIAWSKVIFFFFIKCVKKGCFGGNKAEVRVVTADLKLIAIQANNLLTNSHGVSKGQNRRQGWS